MGLFATAAEITRRTFSARAALPPPTTAPSRPTTADVYGPPKRIWTRGLNEAIDAVPQTIVTAYQEAEAGRVARLFDLEKGARILDSRLDVVAATRAHAIQGRPVVWKPPPGLEGDAEARRIAANVTRLWNNTPRIRRGLGHLAHGVLEPYAVAQLRWLVEPHTGWWTAIPEWVHGNRTCINDGLQVAKCDWGDRWPGVALSEYPDRFIVHQPSGGRSDYPWRAGALRARLIPSILKRMFGVKAWTVLLERWGQPQVAAFYDGDDGDAVQDATISALRAIGIDWRAFFPRGVELKEIPVTVDGELHKRFVDYTDTEHAIAVLHQNLTTDAQGASYASVVGHARVFRGVLEGDCDEMAETLTDQWAEPVVRYNWPGAPVPYAELVVTPKKELGVAEYQAGLYTADEIREAQGHDAEPGGAGRRRFPVPQLAGSQSAAEPSKPSDTKEPGPSKPEGVAGGGAAPTSAGPAAAVPGAEKASDTALNGAQIDALKGIISDVAQGLIPRETGIALITAGFPINATTAEQIMGTVGRGFVPRDPNAPAPAPAPTPQT